MFHYKTTIMLDTDSDANFYTSIKNKASKLNLPPQPNKKIQAIENAQGDLICIFCLLSGSIYSTFEEEEFANHLSLKHSTDEAAVCVYCDLKVKPESVLHHLNSHNQQYSVDAFECSYCSLHTNSLQKFSKHQCSLSTDDQSVSCGHCNKQFDTQSSLFGHINEYICVVTHCTAPGCFVKSSSFNYMRLHFQHKHPGLFQQFITTTQVFCNDTGVLPRAYLSINDLQSALVGALLGQYPVNNAPSKNLITNSSCEEGRILSLVCTGCHFGTTWMSRFKKHKLTCALSASIPYKLFSCPLCQAVSTTSQIVAEHIETQHNGAEVTVLSTTVSLPNSECASNSEGRVLKRYSSRSDDDIGASNKRLCLSEVSQPSPKDQDKDSLYVEYIRFPIEESALESDFHDSLNDPDVIAMTEKLKLFASYKVPVYIREGNRRTPRCPDCSKDFYHGKSDFKRHVMSVHLGISRNTAKDYLRYIGPEIVVDTGYVVTADVPASASPVPILSHMRQHLPKSVEQSSLYDRRYISLPYSKNVLAALISNLPRDLQLDLSEKMKLYSKERIIFETTASGRRFSCGKCNYSSTHAMADVRKHVLGGHCGISTKLFRFCLQASRLDPLDFSLFPDDRLLKLAQQLEEKRQQDSNKSMTDDVSIHDDDDSSSRLSLPAINNNNNYSYNGNVQFDRDTYEDTSISFGRKDVFTLAVDYDSDEKIDLTFSEPVLRQLLRGVATVDQTSEIIQKMRVYSSFKLIKLNDGDKTVAFRCTCNRVFHTYRLPNSKIRPSTLADCRRHIMSVHAKIAQEYLTICCQASRFSKETNFRLYNDEMLLRLASDKPIKMPPSLPQFNNNNNEVSDPKLTDGHSTPNNSRGAMPRYSMNIPSASESTREYRASVNWPELDEPIGSNVRLLPPSKNLIPPEDIPHPVERSVDLPYSQHVLQLLVADICPPGYSETLNEKMDVYSSYKVYITRQNGRRIFYCPGCGASSPHGMGDIRKHILGVHAKVPERYKAAAMFCSRLSREDYALLPDRLLLHLANARPKTSPVQSLDQKALSQVSFTPSHQNHITQIRSGAAYSPFSSISMVGPDGKLFNTPSPKFHESYHNESDVDANTSQNDNGNDNTNGFEVDEDYPSDPEIEVVQPVPVSSDGPNDINGYFPELNASLNGF